MKRQTKQQSPIVRLDHMWSSSKVNLPHMSFFVYPKSLPSKKEKRVQIGDGQVAREKKQRSEWEQNKRR